MNKPKYLGEGQDGRRGHEGRGGQKGQGDTLRVAMNKERYLGEGQDVLDDSYILTQCSI